MSDPDPTLHEMFVAEDEALESEIDDLILNILPPLLLPPSSTYNLPAMMTLNVGIGGGEAARFLEEISVLYTRYAEKEGWSVEVMNAVEGPPGKGSGSNGFREMTMKFIPSQWDKDKPCYGDLMWENGTHRVQRVPPGATVDKLQSSTITISVRTPHV